MKGNNIVNEQSNAILSLSFRDENGNKITPTSGRYRIDDMASGAVVTPWAVFSPTISSYDIVISGAENTLVNEYNEAEQRMVTIVIFYSSGRQTTIEYIYNILNMQHLPPIQEVIIQEPGVASDQPS